SAGVRIVLDPAPELVSLTADASQIEQVLVNLVKNAIEACESLDSDARRVVIRTRPGASGGIAVEVEDPAPMLAPEILKRIGEPFFTTKADGLGLGLSISRTLLENYGCRLSIRPLDGGGKAFHFELPPPHEPN
ncbi:MAG TPA: ATP-binding protein, partial [Rhodocyclaceae bacterium]|nr:ATP-binding protein [Rhodocyclaceae bacterium]